MYTRIFLGHSVNLFVDYIANKIADFYDIDYIIDASEIVEEELKTACTYNPLLSDKLPFNDINKVYLDTLFAITNGVLYEDLDKVMKDYLKAWWGRLRLSKNRTYWVPKYREFLSKVDGTYLMYNFNTPFEIFSLMDNNRINSLYVLLYVKNKKSLKTWSKHFYSPLYNLGRFEFTSGYGADIQVNLDGYVPVTLDDMLTQMDKYKPGQPTLRIKRRYK